MVRRLKADVLEQLPPKRRQQVSSCLVYLLTNICIDHLP